MEVQNGTINVVVDKKFEQILKEEAKVYCHRKFGPLSKPRL